MPTRKKIIPMVISNVGEPLDRIGEADYDGIYRTIALSAFRQYEMPLTKTHSDEAVKYASELVACGFKEGIYVADRKLVTKELVAAMNDAERGLRFVSRRSANFGDSNERENIVIYIRKPLNYSERLPARSAT
jgi:hypothetical protein